MLIIYKHLFILHFDSVDGQPNTELPRSSTQTATTASHGINGNCQVSLDEGDISPLPSGKALAPIMELLKSPQLSNLCMVISLPFMQG